MGLLKRAYASIALAAPLLIVAAVVVGVWRRGLALWLLPLFVVVLVALMLLAARAATAGEHYRVAVRVHQSGPPRRAVLLCNPDSGDGKVEEFGLLDLARDLGVEAVVLEDGDDLEQLARDAVARGADCLGMAGGDGSQALVASIAVEHDLPFVCVSAGTRNHFAVDLGYDVDDPRESMQAFRDAVERRVDYATVNDRLFVNNVSLGLYAEIVSDDSYRDAKAESVRAKLTEILTDRAEPYDIAFTTPEGEHIDTTYLLLVSNNPYVVTLAADIGSRRRLDTGSLGVVGLTAANGAEAARAFAAAAAGMARTSALWREFTTTRFEVRARDPKIAAGVDGEACELESPLHFEIHPRGLRLLVPADSIERAQRRGARDAGIRDVIAIAMGRARWTGPGPTADQTTP